MSTCIIIFISCRAFEAPFFIGTVFPFLMIYIFNWIVFIIIMISLIRKYFSTSSLKDVKDKENKSKAFFKQQLVIALTLSVLFGIGWGIGLLATQGIYNNKIVRDVFAALFVVATTFHGLFIFVMHSLRSNEVRNVWNSWIFRLTGKNFIELTPSAVHTRRKSSDAFGNKNITKANVSSYGGSSMQYTEDLGIKQTVEEPDISFEAVITETTFTKSFPDEEVDEKEEIRQKEEA